MRISWTISRYIFWDLLRIFLMASGALAGIMSFGGLLRPLTQQGLDSTQVMQMLTYFTPAMTAYSFPIAALFATTVVYGRLSADNELTACRAGGISHGAVALPAICLGLLVAVVSLVFLSFVVPAFTLKVERVVYSNIAKFVATKIERTHQIKFPGSNYTVYAQEAYLPPADSLKPGEQQVVLIGPTIVSFDRPYGKEDWGYVVPKEFWTASRATLYIQEPDRNDRPAAPRSAPRQPALAGAGGLGPAANTGAPGASQDPDELTLTIALENGSSFPREFKGAVRGGVGATQFGPVPIRSPINENTKFMDVWQLKELYQNRHESRKIRALLTGFIRRDQEMKFTTEVRDALNDKRQYVFKTLRAGEEYVLEPGSEGALEKSAELLVPARPNDPDRKVRLRKIVHGKVETIVEAREARMTAWPRRAAGQIEVSLKLHDTVSRTKEGDVPRAVLPLSFRVKMPPSVRELEGRALPHYTSLEAAHSGDQNQLNRELIILANDIVSESNARASFAVSCFVLVLVGCALGMMFRSGNFLTAFAVSFIPALLSITLIIAGQRACGNIPWNLKNFTNPLPMGVALIWSGNVVNFAIGAGLLWRLRRT